VIKTKKNALIFKRQPMGCRLSWLCWIYSWFWETKDHWTSKIFNEDLIIQKVVP